MEIHNCPEMGKLFFTDILHHKSKRTDAFFPNKTEIPTIIVMDRASIHNSNAIYEKLEEWKERNITLFELPSYSPHLNIIEILWRKIKYEWLKVDAYCRKFLWTLLKQSYENLEEKLM